MHDIRWMYEPASMGTIAPHIFSSQVVFTLGVSPTPSKGWWIPDLKQLCFVSKVDKELASGEYFLKEKEKRLKAQEEKKVTIAAEEKHTEVQKTVGCMFPARNRRPMFLDRPSHAQMT